MTSVSGLILAGEHSWDDSVFSRLMPRALMPVADRPLIGHALAWFAAAGVREVMICANSASRLVRRELGDGSAYDVQLSYYEDWTPRGPAGCVRDGALGTSSEHVVVLEGAVFPAHDLVPILAAHLRERTDVCVAASRTLSSSPHVQSLSPVGVYVCSRAAVQVIPATGYQDLKEGMIPAARAAGLSVSAIDLGSPWPRIACERSYFRLNGWMLDRMSVAPPPGYRKVGESLIHESARVAESSRLIGPTLIGPGARLDADSALVGPAWVGEGCRIGTRAIVARSILWPNCSVGEGMVIDHQLLPAGSVVGELPPEPSAESAPASKRRSRMGSPRPLAIRV